MEDNGSMTREELIRFCALGEAVKLYKGLNDEFDDETIVETTRRFAEFIRSGKNLDAPDQE